MFSETLSLSLICLLQIKNAATAATVGAVGVGVVALAALGAALFSSVSDDRRRRRYDD